MDDGLCGLRVADYLYFRCQPIIAILVFIIYPDSFAAYFIINQPQASTQWVNNVSTVITWTKGVEDGVTMFDLEMTSMSQDGLLLIARNSECVNSIIPPKSHLSFSSQSPQFRPKSTYSS